MLLLNISRHAGVAHLTRASRTTVLHHRVTALLHLMVVVSWRLGRCSMQMVLVLLLLMMSSLSVLGYEVLLVGGLIVRLHMVRLDG